MKILGILILLMLAAGCTIIALNKGAVTTTESDSHDAGTNGNSFDVNISPK